MRRPAFVEIDGKTLRLARAGRPQAGATASRCCSTHELF
jgi:hypothetical protein